MNKYNNILYKIYLGSKKGLIKRLKDSDLYFVTTLHRRLNVVNQRFVDQIIGQTLHSQEMGNEILSKINSLNVTRNIIRQLKPNILIQHNCIDVICEMFNKRDDRICRSHHDVNRESHNYQEWKPSLFYSTQIIESLIEDPFLNGFTTLQLQSREDIILSTAQRLYFTYKGGNLFADIWCLVIVDIPLRKLFYVNPKLDTNLITEEEEITVLSVMESFEIALNPLLSMMIEAYEGNWECTFFPNMNFSFLQNDFDSGIYIAMILYFLANDCPPTFLDSDMNKWRSNLAYWMLNESLPT